MIRTTHLTAVAASAALFFLAGIAVYTFSVNTVLKQAKRRAEADSRVIMEEDGALQDIVDTYAEIIDGRIVVVDGDSRRLADSQMGSGHSDDRFINMEIIEARRVGTVVDIEPDPETSAAAIVVANRVDRPSGAVVVYIAYPTPEIQQLRPVLIAFGLAMLVSAAALTYFVGRFIAHRMQRPIKTLVQYTGKALSGGFRKLSVDTGDEEIAGLVDQFNLLVDRYGEMIRSDDKKFSRINTLLSNINTGILMVDLGNSITLVNPMAERLLELNKLSLFRIRSTEEPRIPVLDAILELTAKVNERGNSLETRLQAPNERILDISVDPIIGRYAPHETGGALVIIRDVTEITEMERLKDEFVANVSHELRTPLTVIAGFVETLKTGETLSPNDRTTALNIIDVETERMKSLVSELLHLSRIAGDMGHLRLGIIDASAIVSEVVFALSPLAEKKSLNIRVVLPEEPVEISGLAGWYRQIALNLYGNAVKYTPDGGDIRVEIIDDGSTVYLEVEDNGIGISEDQQEYIFDRFYRVESDNSETPQGSGLGLTIARHIIEELDGSISVKSSLGSGSLFRAAVPRTNEKRSDDHISI